MAAEAVGWFVGVPSRQGDLCFHSSSGGELGFPAAVHHGLTMALTALTNPGGKIHVVDKVDNGFLQ